MSPIRLITRAMVQAIVYTLLKVGVTCPEKDLLKTFNLEQWDHQMWLAAA